MSIMLLDCLHNVLTMHSSRRKKMARLSFNVIRSLRDRITEARVEHPLVICRTAPDNKREERTSELENKFSNPDATHPRPRYIQNIFLLQRFN